MLFARLSTAMLMFAVRRLSEQYRRRSSAAAAAAAKTAKSNSIAPVQRTRQDALTSITPGDTAQDDVSQTPLIDRVLRLVTSGR